MSVWNLQYVWKMLVVTPSLRISGKAGVHMPSDNRASGQANMCLELLWSLDDVTGSLLVGWVYGEGGLRACGRGLAQLVVSICSCGSFVSLALGNTECLYSFH